MTEVSLANRRRGKHVRRAQRIDCRHHHLLTRPLRLDEQRVAQIAERVEHTHLGVVPLRAGVGRGEEVQHFQMRGTGQPDLAQRLHLISTRTVVIEIRMAEVREKNGCDLDHHVGHELAVAGFGNREHRRTRGQRSDGDAPRARLTAHPQERHHEHVIVIGHMCVDDGSARCGLAVVPGLDTANGLEIVAHGSTGSPSLRRASRSRSTRDVGSAPSRS